MRKSLAVALAIGSFGLGAWLSPRMTAQQSDVFPIKLEAKQRVSIAAPGAPGVCEIERQASAWVKCQGPEWWNLATGYGFRIHEPSK
jgi:hypothetical protein